jgi:hypothetical protein
VSAAIMARASGSVMPVTIALPGAASEDVGDCGTPVSKTASVKAQRPACVIFPAADGMKTSRGWKPSSRPSIWCWAKILGFTGTPELAHAEIATFRNLVLHVAAHITRGARQVRLRIDHTWKYARAIAEAWLTIRAAFS